MLAAAALLGVGILVAVGLFVLGWLAVPFRVASPQNVQDQWRFAYEYDEALKAQARQLCAAEQARDRATSDGERSQRASQALALEQNYARIAGEYNARLRNAF